MQENSRRSEIGTNDAEGVTVALLGTRRDLDGSSHSPVQVETAGDKGQGVFASRAIREGEAVIVGRPVATSRERTWQSLQVDVDRHIKIDQPFELVNHSCDPTCGVRPNDHGAYTLVARRDIRAGEEITFDYCMTEFACVGFTRCACGSSRCRQTIRGAGDLSPARLKEYEGLVAPHLALLLGA